MTMNNLLFFFLFAISTSILLAIAIILSQPNYLHFSDKEFSMKLTLPEQKLGIVLFFTNIIIIYKDITYVLFMPISSIFFLIYFKIFKYMLTQSNLSIKVYLTNAFSESNMSSRFMNCATYFISPVYFMYNSSLAKFVCIISTRILFSGKIEVSYILKILIFIFISVYFNDIRYMCGFEICVCTFTPVNTRSYETIEERLRDLPIKEPTLKESIINSEDTDFNHLIAGDVNEYNITKANICYENMEKESKDFGRSIQINDRARRLVEKLNKDNFIENGSSIHSNFTYDELALLKFYGKYFPAKTLQGYNGILQKGDFTEQQPNNISITKSLNPNTSAFGFYFSQQVSEHKNYLIHEIKRSNNQTWVVR